MIRIFNVHALTSIFKYLSPRNLATTAIASAILLGATGAAGAVTLNYVYYLGGGGLDIAKAVTTDAKGNIYIAVTSSSANFPGLTAGALGDFQYKGSFPCVITELDPSGTHVIKSAVMAPPGSSSLVYMDANQAVSLSKDGDCNPTAIKVDVGGNVIVAGSTNVIHVEGDGNHPTAYLKKGMVGFVTSMDASLSKVNYSVILGGYDKTSHSDGKNYYWEDWSQTLVTSLALDAVGNAYVGGRSDSKKLPTTSGVLQNKMCYEGAAGFVMAINPSGTITSGTYVGDLDKNCDVIYEPSSTQINDLELDSAGNLVLVGHSDSPHFYLSSDAFQSDNQHSTSGFVLKLSNDLKSSSYGSFIFASLEPECLVNSADAVNFQKYVGLTVADSVSLDKSDNVYIAGLTRSPCLPVTTNAVQKTMLADDAGYVMRLNSKNAVDYMSYVDLGANSDTSSIRVFVDGNTSGSGSKATFYITHNSTNASSASWKTFTAPSAQLKNFGTANAFLEQVEIAADGATSTMDYVTGFGGTLPTLLFGGTLTPDGKKVVVVGTTKTGDLPASSGSISSINRGKNDGIIGIFNIP